MKNEYLRKLNEAFKDFKFFEQDHHYEFKNKKIGISVTKLLEEYANEFDKEKVAEMVATKNQQIIDRISKDRWATEEDRELQLKILSDKTNTVQGNLDLWELKNLFACAKGHTCHEFAQCLWSHNLWQRETYDGSLEFRQAVDTINEQAYHFMNDYCDKLEHLADEFVIGSEEYDIASAIDHLFINSLTGGLVLVDYKTNTDIYKNEEYAKNMKMPLHKLKDTKLNHYAIQLSIYKYLVEKYAGIKVSEMFIVWFSECNENYKIIKVPYLKMEVEKILELRRAKKMSKMILVMGEPASGKTVSLRNIPKNELYYIDCDKKGLNYKGWKNDFNEGKKNYCRTNNGENILSLLKGISDKRNDIHYIAIDTINSVMIADEMVRMKGKNYNEWQDLAKCIFEEIDTVPDLRDDIVVIFLGHTQTDDDGFVRLLTNGRKLNKIGLEKYFDTVLISKIVDGKYMFETHSDKSTARVPMGFDCGQYIENDLYEIIKQLKEF